MGQAVPRSPRAILLLLASALPLFGSAALAADFDERILAAHNRERGGSGLAPLEWSADLAQEAGRWAATLAATQRFEHERSGRADASGENLWAGTHGRFTLEQMVDAWLVERIHYKPGTFPDNSRTGNVADVGHYTQIMWRRTRELGCAIVQGEKEDLLVCRYRPAGNVLGDRPF